MLNLSVVLEDSVRRLPRRVALVAGDRRLSYAEVDARASRVAHLLVARGVRPGDRVALSCPNLPEFPIVYFGILKAGAVVVPLNILLKPREIAYHLADSGAVLYFCHEGTADLPMGEYGRAGFEATAGCREMFLITDDMFRDRPETFESVPREPTDTAVILYTSGTTGRPKGAELSHANMVLNALTATRLFDSSPARPDIHLLALPLFHSFGQSVSMNAGLSAGATLVLMPRFEPQAALRLMREERITAFAGVPTMYWGLLGALDHDTDDVDHLARSLRLAVSGGSALPVEIHTRFAERFGVRIREGYGLSETSPLALFTDPEGEPRPGSIGVPVWGVEARLVDRQGERISGDGQVGELVLRGHNVMKGYHNRPEETARTLRDGWLRTGDLARVDEDGRYYIVDRTKDLIIRGGYNVYPREIEEVLMSHPDVSLASVIGVPDARNGEEVRAFVVLEATALITETELIAWCKEQMAGYKYPRSVVFSSSLPMTATGKILKRELSGRPEAGT
ncbi:long-chain-fatty-acid--CoA ligase [Streptomyces sp. BE230]|uniref:long-chain-fatty-acid--CoA ligase n=1 Tax=Streptomyces sp. BE230 TaxID=3002526 RepID=UPI002ED0474E|nr:long-chain fatty acid--CoA ligase [Streptomyces sp. BE230]